MQQNSTETEAFAPRKNNNNKTGKMSLNYQIFNFLLYERKNVNVICLPTEHQGVHCKNSFRNVRAFQDRIGIWKCWFLRRGENQSTRRKTSRNREENQQQTQPTYDAGSRNRTRDTLVGGERSHHYAIPAPPKYIVEVSN